MFTKSKCKTIFLDYESDAYTSQEKVNVILSPSLYWVKKLSVPIKYLREVKKLLPSFFEEHLIEGNYSYEAYKEGDHYIAFAYDDKKILSLMEQKGLTGSNVEAVYFAQSELVGLQNPVSISDTHALISKDDIVLVLQKTWLGDLEPLDVETLELSKHKVKLSLFHHIVDTSIFYRLSVAVFVLGVMFLAQAYKIQSDASQIQSQKEELFSKYKLKQTMMQNKAMLKKYEALHTKQMKIRESIAKVIAPKLSGDEKLVSLELKGEKLIVEFQTKNAQKIENVLKKEGLDLSAKKSQEKLVCEVKL